MPLIQLQNISKTYYIGAKVAVRALQGIDLSIESGEFVAIMGHSGSGKSTLLAILGLLDKADQGKYLFLKDDISKLGENQYAYLRSRFFGFVFQSFNLLPKLNVLDNVMLPFIYSGEKTSEKKRQTIEMLKKLGLGDRLLHRSNELSGGQQQRVALGRALVNQPLVILADEPTGNLDSASSEEIMRLLKELNEQGNTIIMVTHEPDIAAWSSRVLTLKDGKIIKDEIKRKSESRQIDQNAGKISRSLTCSHLSGIKNYCYEAYLALVNNKLRSFLSILGVLIGVAAIITMLALGTGAKRNMEESLSRLGTNTLMVRATRQTSGISMGTSGATRFTFEDLNALKKIDAIQHIVPYVSSRAQVVYRSKNWNTSITGTTVDYKDLKKIEMDKGRFFNVSEERLRSKVVLLGKTVAQELFENENPVGSYIRVNRINFEVIGVLKEQGAAGWRNQDDQIILPIRTAMYRLMGEDYINYFDVKVRQAEDIPYVEEEVVNEIMRLHRLPEAQRQSIEIVNMAEIQKTATEMINALAYLLGAVAAISLLVGGIGIMNIMLVMVMERTHEIGLRKAIGAQKSDILLQFLVESVLICVFGGILGILLGMGVSYLLSSFAQWVVYISLGSIILSFTFVIIIGVVFGLWPAWRAAKLLPIEALRYE